MELIKTVLLEVNDAIGNARHQKTAAKEKLKGREIWERRAYDIAQLRAELETAEREAKSMEEEATSLLREAKTALARAKMASQTTRRGELEPKQAVINADAAVVLAQQTFPVVHNAIETKKKADKAGKEVLRIRDTLATMMEDEATNLGDELMQQLAEAESNRDYAREGLEDLLSKGGM